MGGGPAGSATALTLLALGLPVTILERARFPRHRPGETLHPGIEPLLERLGALPSILDARFLRHTGHWVHWAGSARFVGFGRDSRGPWRGYQASRGELDRRLLAVAAGKGAAVLGRAALAPRVDGSRVIGVGTADGPLDAAYTVDCTGDAQWLSRRLRIATAYHSPPLLARYGYATGRVPACDRLPCLRADGLGWTWIAEVEPGRFHWTRVTRPGDRPPARWLPPPLEETTPQRSGGADVTWRIGGCTAGPGWFVAGDAAAALDPSSSHGVLRAIMTGMMAGHLVAQALRGEASEASCAHAYRTWLTAWFRHDATALARAYGEANLFGFGESSTILR